MRRGKPRLHATTSTTKVGCGDQDFRNLRTPKGCQKASQVLEELGAPINNEKFSGSKTWGKRAEIKYVPRSGSREQQMTEGWPNHSAPA